MFLALALAVFLSVPSDLVASPQDDLRAQVKALEDALEEHEENPQGRIETYGKLAELNRAQLFTRIVDAIRVLSQGG